ncbi:MAG: hypothetical protein V1726_04045 [Methanobacteriota archaeon]
MIKKEDFEGRQYEIFKQEAEAFIAKYQAGDYKTEIKEIKVRIENIMRMTNGDPRVYLEYCSLYKFLMDMYKTEYVKNIIQFAKDRGFSFYLPQEMNTNHDMESFASSLLHHRRSQEQFDINQYLVLSFAKNVDAESGTVPYLFSFPLLHHTGSLLFSQLTVAKMYDIMSGITHLESLVKI